MKKLEKTRISKSYKGVRCIENISIQKHLTLGKVYEVFAEGRENYHVIDDKNELNSFKKVRFEDVKRSDEEIIESFSTIEFIYKVDNYQLTQQKSGKYDYRCSMAYKDVNSKYYSYEDIQKMVATLNNKRRK